MGDATFNGNVLNENLPYTQLVWIPRYAYKIESMYHQNGDETTAGEISVVFIDTANQNTTRTTTYSTTHPGGTTGGAMNGYVVHPAFEYGGQHLSGFWVGKFETSHTGCTTDVTTGQAEYTGNEVITVRANVTSWRNFKIGDIFTTCLNINRTGNPYGLNTNDNVVDPHLLKNDEWGAVAYLSKSRFGKETEEVYGNNNSNYITGIAGDTVTASSSTSTTNSYKTLAGTKASTTGNVTGVYDMSGGAYERTAAYINNGSTSLTEYGGALTATGTAERYRNVYASPVNDGSDAKAEEYELANPMGLSGKYGDAVYETSNEYSSSYGGWYSDYSIFPSGVTPLFERGGNYGGNKRTGIYFFGYGRGNKYAYSSFRIGLVVL